MKNKISLLIIFFMLSNLTIGQNISDESLAREYHRQGEFKKAAQLFKEVYKKKKVKSVYDKYVDCLIKTQSYKEAEKTIKTFYKKNKNPIILIDLGKLYTLTGKDHLAFDAFNQALKEGEKTKKYLPTLGSKFFKAKKYEFALTAYSLARKDNNKPSYSIQIANIYSYLGNIESMYKELIQLLLEHPNYFQTTKNMIRRTISENDQNENNKKLKKNLLKTIQKTNSYEVSKMMVWLFLQEKKFNKALEYEISIDKRILNNTIDIIALAEVALSNQDYTTTLNALKYIADTNDTNSYYYEYSQLKILDVKFAILETNKIKKDDAIITLKTEYYNTLERFGIKSETIFTLNNYCHLLSTYLNQENEAIKILENTIKNTSLDKYDIAICKMELAQILTSTDQIWEAILIYSQVEKSFKDDIIGQQAKFEKTKINYYKGDFEWAQNQLNVLKLSTSKLISNNAMQLSLLISDNLNLDTTNTALLFYAKSELLFKQKKYLESLEKLEELEKKFPNHTLADEVLLKKFEIFIETKDYTKAVNVLNLICKEYYYDILYDDALFYQAQVYELLINDKTTATKKYEELLLNCPNSIFVNQARERYKQLRTNNFLKLQ